MLHSLIGPIIKKYKRQYLSMVVVSFMGIALLSALSSAYKTQKSSLLCFMEEYRLADGAVLLSSPAPSSLREELLQIEGVREVDPRLMADIPVRLSSGRLLSLRAFTHGKYDFGRRYTWEEAERGDCPNVSLERKFAYHNQIHAGDRMEIKIGEEFQTVCVGSVVSTPECLRVTKDEFMASENSDFSYLFIPEELLSLTEYRGSANQFLFRFEENADGEKIMSRAEEILRENSARVIYSFTREGSAMMQMVNEALSVIRILAIFLPSALFFCAVIITALFISQITRMCRSDMGILRALGFQIREIRKLFCRITLRISLISSALGLLFGVFVYAGVTYSYLNYFTIPQPVYEFDIPMILLSIVLTVVCGQIATFFGTGILSKVSPTEAMTRDITDTRAIPAWMDGFFEKKDPIYKFGVVALFRNGRSFLFSSLCLIAAVVPVFAALSLECSHKNIIAELSNKRIHFDAEIFFDRKQDGEILQLLEETGLVTDCEFAEYVTGELSFGEKKELVKLNLIDPATQKVTIYDEKGRPMHIPPEGIVLDAYTAEKLGAGLGDTVDLAGKDFKVTAFSFQNLNLTQYASRFGKDQDLPGKYVIRCRMKKEDQNRLLEVLSGLDGYSYTIFPDVQLAGVRRDFSMFSLSIYLLLGFSVVMGITVLYNTTLTNLFSQRKELAVLRTLGFRIGVLRRSWLPQTGGMLFAALLAGIPLGMLFSKWTQYLMTTEHFVYASRFEWWQFALTVLLSVFTALISHTAAFDKMKTWNIAEMTKDKE